MLNRKHIRRRFERVASRFDSADFVHATTREGLLSRLEPVLIEAKTVIDLGAATGSTSRALEKRFKKANVISVDIAHSMLCEARKKKSWLSRASYAQADAVALPFRNACVDLVFANMLLPWLDDPTPVFTEVARVLRKNGVFAFTTLGPDSLREIARAWGQVDAEAHVNRFSDMHNLGDGLVNAGLRDPVVDVDRLSINYKNSERLFADLTNSGARNTLIARSPTLTGKGPFDAMIAALTDADRGDITLNLELIYGHCWGSGPKMDPENYRIDATQIPLRRS